MDAPGTKLYLDHYGRQNVVVIALVRVPEHARGQGVMRRAVSTVVEAADVAGVRLAVTPTDEWGADLARLRRFYEGFGFVRNAGEHRDWGVREDYIRPVGGAQTRPKGTRSGPGGPGLTWARRKRMKFPPRSGSAPDYRMNGNGHMSAEWRVHALGADQEDDA